jgi:hypothetical protein
VRFLLYGPVPWLLPGLLLSAVVGLVAARWIGGRLRVNPAVAFTMIVGIGLVVSATLTPLRGAIEHGATGQGACDLSRVWPIPPTAWFELSDPAMNVWMFVPLGLAIGLVPRSHTKVGLIVAAIALPFLIESIQLAVPVLARGCEAADVVDNLTGLVLGLAAGAALGLLARATAGGGLGGAGVTAHDETPAERR